MERGVFRIIPLTFIPLPSPRPFPPAIIAKVNSSIGRLPASQFSIHNSAFIHAQTCGPGASVFEWGHGCGGKPAGKNRMSSIASFDEFVPQLRAFMTRSQEEPAADLDTEFNRLALALFALQRDAVPIYGEFCRKRKVSAVADWRDIPALPATAFKEYDVTSLPPAERTHVFYSSGTSQRRPSRHYHNAQSLAVYEESLRPWFRRHFVGVRSSYGFHLCQGYGGRATESSTTGWSHGSTESRPTDGRPTGWSNPRLVVLTPPPAGAPHSSLAHMFGAVCPDFSGALFTGRVDGDGAWALDLEQTTAALREAQSAGQPVALLGTALSFVHLLEHCRAGQTRFQSAAGSRALETGGYKGRGRATPKGELRQMMTRWLGIPESHILGEYGMSELSSQAYDRILPETGGGFRFPPWARAQIISPETGREAGDGETGMVRVFDLANVRSALAVQTEDLGVRRGDGFELTGRAAGSAARGCSLMLERL
jgi:hypothetical protein